MTKHRIWLRMDIPDAPVRTRELNVDYSEDEATLAAELGAGTLIELVVCFGSGPEYEGERIPVYL